jgi:hypothetical protein
MQRTFTAECAAHARAVAEAAGRHVGRPIVRSARSNTRLLRGRGAQLAQISAKTSIPKASLHRYLAPHERQVTPR